MQPHAFDSAQRGVEPTPVRTRRINTLLALTILGLVGFFWGCSDTSVPVTPLDPGTGVQPLAVGSSWTFVDSVFGTSVSTSPLTIKVSGKSTYAYQGSNREVFVWDVYAGSSLLRRNLIRNESNGLWHYAEIDGVNDDTLHVRKMWARYPTSRGESYTEDRYTYNPSTHGYAKTDTWTWSCLSTSEPIPVGNGITKPGIVYWTQVDGNTEHRLFYVPEIGYAGWETKVDKKVTFRETLTSYSLK